MSPCSAIPGGFLCGPAPSRGPDRAREVRGEQLLEPAPQMGLPLEGRGPEPPASSDARRRHGADPELRPTPAEGDAETPDPHLWTGGLLALSAQLQHEARLRAPRWAWRRLRGGACVSCRVHPEHQVLQVRIARVDRPGLKAQPKWEQEIQTFIRYLGLAGWQRADVELTDAGGVAALFLAPPESREVRHGG